MSEDQALPKKRTGLGRGLSSLLGEIQADTAVAVSGRADAGVPLPDGVRLVPVASLQPLPNQPRRNFDEDALDELARSISALGVLQPIVVRDLGGQYQIVAGERRWRAFKMLGKLSIPAIVVQASDEHSGVCALIENVHRTDLNPMDRAIAVQKLSAEFSLTHDKLAEKLSLDRSTVTNYMRLLKLPPHIQVAIRDNKLLLTEQIMQDVRDGLLTWDDLFTDCKISEAVL
ncbi:MAG: ParB/RepB/Spo0J family partition protein, partial [Sphingomonadaceae bacterium]|nr:ParB/RepB/Spo0J family partition protein [Sphingomonadaceae bacterium]